MTSTERVSGRGAGGGSRNRVCKRCKFSTTDAKEFLHHQINAHSTESIEVYACEKCDYISHAYNDLIQHKRTLHPIPTPTKLLAPNNATARQQQQPKAVPVPVLVDDRNNNQKTKIGGRSFSPGANGHSGLYICDNCGDEHSSAKEHYQHRKEEHFEDLDIVECDICDFASEHRSELIKHHASVHAVADDFSDKDSDQDRESPVYMEGVSEDIVVSDSDGDLHIDEGRGRSPIVIEPNMADYKAPLQIVMEMQAGQRGDTKSLFSGDHKMSANFLEAMSSRMGHQGITGNGHGKPSGGGMSSSKGLTASGRPRCTPVREAVDPAKYMTIQEGDGVKYACSKCGNIYKWRKSLNKHWKEKHEGEVPDPRSTVTPLTIPQPSKSQSSFATFVQNPIRLGTMGVSMGVKAQNASAGGASFLHSKQGPFRSLPQQMPPSGPMGFAVSTASNSISPRRVLPSGMYRSTIGGGAGGNNPSGIIPTLPSRSPVFQTSLLYNKRPAMTSPSSDAPQPAKRSSPTPPAAHIQRPIAHRPSQPPGMNHPTADLAGLYDKAYDDDDDDGQVLDLSKKPKPASLYTKAKTPPPQDEPLDFSSNSPKPPPPLLSTPHSQFRYILNMGRSPPPMPPLHPSPRLMQSHQRSSDSPVVIEPTKSKPSYHCTMCSYASSTSIELEDHMQLHQTARKKYQCAECPESYVSMEDLNMHFSMCHVDVLQNKLNESGLSAEGSKVLYKCLMLELSARPPSMSVPQETTCLVCGAYYQWQDVLAKHFAQEHVDLPNPYTVKIPSNTAATTPTKPTALPLEKAGQLKQQGRERTSASPQSLSPDSPRTPSKEPSQEGEDLTLVTPDGKLIDLEGENTAIVIPMAPEDSPSTPRRKSKGGRVHSSPSSHTSSIGAAAAGDSAELLLPYKCSVCEYRARWPSEITQHMKNHSDEKPYHCPRCSYRSKWKWDVVKHLKRCGGGTVKDVIDTTKVRKQQHVNDILSGVPSLGASPDGLAVSQGSRELSKGPPNVTVMSLPLNLDSSKDGDLTSENSRSVTSDDASMTEYSETGPIQQFFCGQCPFIGNSSAELKRHQRVHVDEKPFICKTCGYCSRWKCDLKKHLRTYNHTSAVPLTYGGHGRKPADWKEQELAAASMSAAEQEEEEHSMDNDKQSDEEPDLEDDFEFKDNSFNTPKKSAQSENEHSPSPVKSVPAGKYKCKKCEFVTNDLPTFLQHKITHTSQLEDHAFKPLKITPEKEAERDSTPETPTHTSKHRRKPLKTTKTVVEESRDSQDDMEDMMKFETVGEHFNDAEDDMEDEAPPLLEDNSMDSQETEIQEQLDNAKDFQAEDVDEKMKEYTGKENNEEEEEQGEETGVDEDDDEEKAKGITVLQIHKGNKTKYTCKKCPYSSENITNIANHSRQHGANKKYNCEYCDYSLDQWRHIVNHMKTLHGRASDDNADGENVESELSDNDDADSNDEPVSENEWEIAEVDQNQDEAAESPTKRRRMSRSFVASTPSKVLQYTCKTCGFSTVNKAMVARHNHNEKSEDEEVSEEEFEEKADDEKGGDIEQGKESQVDINSNSTETEVAA